MQASEEIVSAMVRRQYGDKMTQLKKLEKDNRSLRVWPPSGLKEHERVAADDADGHQGDFHYGRPGMSLEPLDSFASKNDKMIAEMLEDQMLWMFSLPPYDDGGLSPAPYIDNELYNILNEAIKRLKGGEK